MCCYLCKHPDSSSTSEKSVETEEIAAGSISWAGQMAVAYLWSRDCDGPGADTEVGRDVHLHLDCPGGGQGSDVSGGARHGGGAGPASPGSSGVSPWSCGTAGVGTVSPPAHHHVSVVSGQDAAAFLPLLAWSSAGTVLGLRQPEQQKYPGGI